jgi:hypothetical protein
MDKETKFELIDKIINYSGSEYELADELLKIMGVDIPDLCEDKEPIDLFGEDKVVKNLENEGWKCSFIGL